MRFLTRRDNVDIKKFWKRRTKSSPRPYFFFLSYLQKIEGEEAALYPEEGDHRHEQGRAVVVRVEPQQAAPEEAGPAAAHPEFPLSLLRFDVEKSVAHRQFCGLFPRVVSLQFTVDRRRRGRRGKKHGGREHFEDGGTAAGDGADSQQSLPRGIS